MTGASAAGLEAAARAKQAVRDRVWALLERERAARFPGANGRIPNFAGASAAAAQLASLPPWRAAGVVKANPDAPPAPGPRPGPGRGQAAVHGRAPPGRRASFLLLDPGQLHLPPRRAASISGAARAGRRIALADLRPVDLVVCGSVAVNRQGAPVGKGGGFSDLEFSEL